MYCTLSLDLSYFLNLEEGSRGLEYFGEALARKQDFSSFWSIVGNPMAKLPRT